MLGPFLIFVPGRFGHSSPPLLAILTMEVGYFDRVVLSWAILSGCRPSIISGSDKNFDLMQRNIKDNLQDTNQRIAQNGQSYRSVANLNRCWDVNSHF